MKIKVTELNHSHPLNSFISTIPPSVDISKYCLVRTLTKEMIVRPFLSLDDSPMLRIGADLKKILNPKEDYCEIVPYEESVPEAKDLYVFALIQVPQTFFINLKLVGLEYETDKFKILSIDNNDHKYYEITENTRVYQTNIMPSAIYGYRSSQEEIQKEIYATLFVRDEFDKHKLPCSNVYIMKGGPGIRKTDLCNKVANKINANYLQISLNDHTKSDLSEIITRSTENTIFGFSDGFQNDIAKLCFLCEFISTNYSSQHKNGSLHKHAFIFFIENDEQVEKLTHYFDCKISIFDVKMPLMDKKCQIFTKILNSIPNNLTKREALRLGRMLIGLPLNETEEIIKSVMSTAIYESKHQMKGEGYVLTYNSFMDVMVKNKRVMDINKGFIQRIWDVVARRGNK